LKTPMRALGFKKIDEQPFPFRVTLQRGATRTVLSKCSEYFGTKKPEALAMKDALKAADRRPPTRVPRVRDVHVEGPNLGEGKYFHNLGGADGQSRASVLYIPRGVWEFLNLKHQDFVAFTAEGGKVVMRKAPKGPEKTT